MIKNKYLITTVILVLIVLNIIKWWPSSIDVSTSQDYSSFLSEDLILYGISSSSKLAVGRRDIFLNEEESEITDVKDELMSSEIEAQSNKEIVREVDHNIKLLGVIQKSRGYLGLVSSNDSTHSVRNNDVLENRYRIVRLDIDRMQILDLQNNKKFVVTLNK